MVGAKPEVVETGFVVIGWFEGGAEVVFSGSVERYMLAEDSDHERGEGEESEWEMHGQPSPLCWSDLIMLNAV